MSEPELYTAQQASDPATPAQTLADIAALRPDLRVAVAGNPSAYPGLLEWLGGLGDPQVDAALAARTAAEAPAETWAPAEPVVPPVQPAPAQPAAPYAPPAPSWATGEQQSWQAAPAQPEPAQQWAAQPGAQPGWTGPQPTGPQTWQQPAAPAKRSTGKTVGIVVGVILGVLVLGGIGLFFALRALFTNVGESIDEGLESFAPTFTEELADADLAALRAACAAEDWQACDDLYWAAEIGSDDEEFGSTCGGRTDGSQFSCVDELGGGDTATEDTATEDTATDDAAGTDQPYTFGDDATLDALWTACEGGDNQACDDLYMDSPTGSEYETFGDTCAGRQEAGTGVYCTDLD